ncbi:BrxE family protein [Mesorhizobium sp. M0520]|uniref:BrxE family protein n=1 Tax=Mesorhizobium sp. M0520 TaxID=2956957 RepID=UPI003338156C
MDLTSDQIEAVALFKTRVAVARHGEMDRAKWWNTNKALSSTGAMVFKRGFPRTHAFAQARAVFAVAKQRCDEHFNPPKSATVWRLPQAIEERLEASWEGWLDDAASWSEFFDAVAAPPERDLASLMQRLGLADDGDVAASRDLRRSVEGRSIPLPGTFGSTRRDLALLALGFERGGDTLVVPYARLGDL